MRSGQAVVGIARISFERIGIWRLTGNTARTPANQVQPMVLGLKPRLITHSGKCVVHQGFEVRFDGEIGHGATSGADQVMVVFGEVLGQLEPGEFIGRDNAMHNAGVFEHREVSIDRTLRKVASQFEYFGNGDRMISGVE